MAKLTLYVTDDFKAKELREFQAHLKKRGRSLSDWFETSVRAEGAQRAEHKTEDLMNLDVDAVAARLNSSEDEELEEMFAEGKKWGREWAAQGAKKSELARLVQEEVEGGPVSVPHSRWGWLCKTYPSLDDYAREVGIHEEYLQGEELGQKLGVEAYDDQFVLGFIEGAGEVYDRVRHKL